jgi:hypothetical protein
MMRSKRWCAGMPASWALPLLLALGTTACGPDFPPTKPIDHVCSLLTADEVGRILPGNDGGKEHGGENTPDVWVRACSYSTTDQFVNLAVDGAFTDDGSDFLSIGLDPSARGVEEVSDLGDEAVFANDGIEPEIRVRAKGYLILLSALVTPPPGRPAFVPLAQLVIARLP